MAENKVKEETEENGPHKDDEEEDDDKPTKDKSKVWCNSCQSLGHLPINVNMLKVNTLLENVITLAKSYS